MDDYLSVKAQTWKFRICGIFFIGSAIENVLLAIQECIFSSFHFLKNIQMKHCQDKGFKYPNYTH